MMLRGWKFGGLLLLLHLAWKREKLEGVSCRNSEVCVGCMSFYRLGEVSGEVEKKDGGVGEREGLVEY
jgi:hypothetical protein